MGLGSFFKNLFGSAKETASEVADKAEIVLDQAKEKATEYAAKAEDYVEKAVEKIYEIKNRPRNNPLIVHLKSEKELYKFAINIPIKAKILSKAFWPGPLTLILEKSTLVIWSNIISVPNLSACA